MKKIPVVTVEWDSPEEVPVASLQVDQEYQSPLSDDRACKIAKSFNPDAAGAIVVSRRMDGSLWVIDGQTRAAAARKAGIPTLMAWLHDGLTVENEAAMYADLNVVRKTPSARGVFRARLRAGIEPYVSIAATVERHGLTLSLCNSKSSRTLSCVGTVSNIWRVDEGKLLGRVLEISLSAWPDVEKSFDAAILTGIADMLKRVDGKYSDARIALRLGSVEPIVLIRKAAFVKHETGNEIGKCASKVMIEHVEKRMAHANRIGATK